MPSCVSAGPARWRGGSCSYYRTARNPPGGISPVGSTLLVQVAPRDMRPGFARPGGSDVLVEACLLGDSADLSTLGDGGRSGLVTGTGLGRDALAEGTGDAAVLADLGVLQVHGLGLGGGARRATLLVRLGGFGGLVDGQDGCRVRAIAPAVEILDRLAHLCSHVTALLSVVLRSAERFDTCNHLCDGPIPVT